MALTIGGGRVVMIDPEPIHGRVTSEIQFEKEIASRSLAVSARGEYVAVAHPTGQVTV